MSCPYCLHYAPGGRKQNGTLVKACTSMTMFYSESPYSSHGPFRFILACA